MTERQIGSTYCMHYDTEAKFFLEDEHPSGLHHLVVHYVMGVTMAARRLQRRFPAIGRSRTFQTCCCGR